MITDGIEDTIEISARLPPLIKSQVNEAWLYNDPIAVYSLGWESPARSGELVLTDFLPPEYAQYRYVDISIERVPSNGFHSERSVLRGSLDELGP